MSFVPQVEKPHTVNIAFNQRTIPRSPFIIQVKKTMSKILPLNPGPLFSAVNSLTSLELQVSRERIQWYSDQPCRGILIHGFEVLGLTRRDSTG